jgi:isopenicillin N synthase-like dioxygenase
MIVYEPPEKISKIPIVDFAGAYSPEVADREAVAAAIHRACRETGFFYVVNHGVPEAVIERQFAFSRAFFALPLREKLKIDIRNTTNMRGYESMQAQTLDQGSPPDLKEGLMIGREVGPDHWLMQQGSPFDGANQWPDDLPGFKDQMLDYQDHMIGLGRRLAAMLARSLDLPEDYFAEGLKEPSATVRLLRYPPHPEAALFNQLGSGAHTDWGLITILLQDACGGLEVKTAAGNWIRAEPIEGAFVVNLGDMVPRLTGGLYTSNLHRVLNNLSGRDRYSIPTFFNPHHFYEFGRAPTCPGDDVEEDFVSFGEHVAQMFAKTYGKAA